MPEETAKAWRNSWFQLATLLDWMKKAIFLAISYVGRIELTRGNVQLRNRRSIFTHPAVMIGRNGIPDGAGEEQVKAFYAERK
jgi:hypothetical protein